MRTMRSHHRTRPMRRRLWHGAILVSIALVTSVWSAAEANARDTTVVVVTEDATLLIVADDGVPNAQAWANRFRAAMQRIAPSNAGRYLLAELGQRGAPYGYGAIVLVRGSEALAYHGNLAASIGARAAGNRRIEEAVVVGADAGASNDFVTDLPAALYHELVHRWAKHMRSLGAYAPTAAQSSVELELARSYIDEALTIGDPFALRYEYPSENLLRDELSMPRRLGHVADPRNAVLVNATADSQAIETLRQKRWVYYAFTPEAGPTEYRVFERDFAGVLAMLARDHVLTTTAPMWTRVAERWPADKPLLDDFRRADPTYVRLAGKVIAKLDRVHEWQTQDLMDALGLWSTVMSRMSAYTPLFHDGKLVFTDGFVANAARAGKRRWSVSRSLELRTDARIAVSHERSRSGSGWRTLKEWARAAGVNVLGGTDPDARRFDEWQRPEEVAATGELEAATLLSEQRQIVVQLEGDDTSFQASLALHRKSSETSLWVQVDAQSGEYRTYPSGARVRLATDARLVVVGHGRGPVDDSNAPAVTVGGLEADALAERLQGLVQRLAANQSFPGKVVLVACGTGMLLDGGGDASTFARTLAQRLRARVIGYRGSVAIDSAGHRVAIAEDGSELTLLPARATRYEVSFDGDGGPLAETETTLAPETVPDPPTGRVIVEEEVNQMLHRIEIDDQEAIAVESARMTQQAMTRMAEAITRMEVRDAVRAGSYAFILDQTAPGFSGSVVRNTDDSIVERLSIEMSPSPRMAEWLAKSPSEEVDVAGVRPSSRSGTLADVGAAFNGFFLIQGFQGGLDTLFTGADPTDAAVTLAASGYFAADLALGRFKGTDVGRVTEQIAGRAVGAMFGRSTLSAARAAVLARVGTMGLVAGRAWRAVPVVGTAFGAYLVSMDLREGSVQGYVDAGFDVAITVLAAMKHPAALAAAIALQMGREVADLGFQIASELPRVEEMAKLEKQDPDREKMRRGAEDALVCLLKGSQILVGYGQIAEGNFAAETSSNWYSAAKVDGRILGVDFLATPLNASDTAALRPWIEEASLSADGTLRFTGKARNYSIWDKLTGNTGPMGDKTWTFDVPLSGLPADGPLVMVFPNKNSYFMTVVGSRHFDIVALGGGRYRGGERGTVFQAAAMTPASAPAKARWLPTYGAWFRQKPIVLEGVGGTNVYRLVPGGKYDVRGGAGTDLVDFEGPNNLVKKGSFDLGVTSAQRLTRSAVSVDAAVEGVRTGEGGTYRNSGTSGRIFISRSRSTTIQPGHANDTVSIEAPRGQTVKAAFRSQIVVVQGQPERRGDEVVLRAAPDGLPFLSIESRDPSTLVASILQGDLLIGDAGATLVRIPSFLTLSPEVQRSFVIHADHAVAMLPPDLGQEAHGLFVTWLYGGDAFADLDLTGSEVRSRADAKFRARVGERYRLFARRSGEEALLAAIAENGRLRWDVVVSGRGAPWGTDAVTTTAASGNLRVVAGETALAQGLPIARLRRLVVAPRAGVMGQADVADGSAVEARLGWSYDVSRADVAFVPLPGDQSRPARTTLPGTTQTVRLRDARAQDLEVVRSRRPAGGDRPALRVLRVRGTGYDFVEESAESGRALELETADGRRARVGFDGREGLLVLRWESTLRVATTDHTPADRPVAPGPSGDVELRGSDVGRIFVTLKEQAGNVRLVGGPAADTFVLRASASADGKSLREARGGGGRDTYVLEKGCGRVDVDLRPAPGEPEPDDSTVVVDLARGDVAVLAVGEDLDERIAESVIVLDARTFTFAGGDAALALGTRTPGQHVRARIRVGPDPSRAKLRILSRDGALLDLSTMAPTRSGPRTIVAPGGAPAQPWRWKAIQPQIARGTGDTLAANAVDSILRAPTGRATLVAKNGHHTLVSGGDDIVLSTDGGRTWMNGGGGRDTFRIALAPELGVHVVDNYDPSASPVADRLELLNPDGDLLEVAMSKDTLGDGPQDDLRIDVRSETDPRKRMVVFVVGYYRSAAWRHLSMFEQGPGGGGALFPLPSRLP